VTVAHDVFFAVDYCVTFGEGLCCVVLQSYVVIYWAKIYDLAYFVYGVCEVLQEGPSEQVVFCCWRVGSFYVLQCYATYFEGRCYEWICEGAARRGDYELCGKEANVRHLTHCRAVYDYCG
jgi:hypothetical protein